METKGQMTVWILLLIVVIIMFGISMSNPETPTVAPADLDDYKSFIQDCYDRSFEASVYELGRQGTLTQTILMHMKE